MGSWRRKQLAFPMISGPVKLNLTVNLGLHAANHTLDLTNPGLHVANHTLDLTLIPGLT